MKQYFVRFAMFAVFLMGAGLVFPTQSVEAQDNGQGNFQIIPVEMQEWGVVYFLAFDQESGTILNGSQLIATEIARLSKKLDELKALAPELALIEAFEYLKPGGGAETFRQAIVRETQDFGCDRLVFRVGEREMDSWGFGNVFYGYLTEYLTLVQEMRDLIAVVFSSVGYEPENDLTQRMLGEALAVIMSEKGLISYQEIEEIAQEVDLL